MATSTSSSKLRVMVDTSVLLAGTVWPRFSHEVLRHALRAEFQLLLCQLVIQQARRKFSQKFPDYSEDFEDFLRASGFQEVPDPSSAEVLANRDLVRDITDVPIALAAINAAVDYFLSEDKDFTAKHQSTAKLHQKLHVLLPGMFLREVMGWSSPSLEAIRHRQWSDLHNGEIHP